MGEQVVGSRGDAWGEYLRRARRALLLRQVYPEGVGALTRKPPKESKPLGTRPV